IVYCNCQGLRLSAIPIPYPFHALLYSVVTLKWKMKFQLLLINYCHIKKIVKIKVRVCRILRPRLPGMTDQYIGLHCILVDENQQAIEASSNEIDYEIIVLKIEANGCYEIMNFCTNKMRSQYRVVPHDTHILYKISEEANITLWLDIAHNFSSLSLETLAQPTVAVFTSLKVKVFLENIILSNTSSTLFFIDPDILELNSYKSM
ncbi:hypothetical protein DVH24_018862, partial [Malus domestica]